MSDSVAAAPPAEPPAEPASNGNKSEPEPEHKKEEKPKKAVKPKKKEETKRKQDDSTKKPAVKKVKKDPNAPKKVRKSLCHLVSFMALTSLTVMSNHLLCVATFGIHLFCHRESQNDRRSQPRCAIWRYCECLE